MRHINPYNNFINEKKSVGTIYHFTDPESAVSIIEEDQMTSENFGYISFTRSFDLGPWIDDFGAYVRITFNGGSLSDKFSIEPHLYDPSEVIKFGGGDTEKFQYSFADRLKNYKEEREERIKGPIEGITKYIVQIDVLRKSPTRRGIDLAHDNTAFKKLQQMGIPVNVVDKFTPVRNLY